MSTGPESATDRARRLLPLFDATEPVACTIGDDEIADRLAIVERLRSVLTGIERTETGLVLEVPRRAEVEADLRRFAADEKRCCRFWGFAVVEDDRVLALRWDGPPTATGILDRIHSLLDSDRPVEELRELL